MATPGPRSRRFLRETAVRTRKLCAFVRRREVVEVLTRRVRIIFPSLPEVMPPVPTDTQVAAVFASRHLSGTSPLAARNRTNFAVLLDFRQRVGELGAIEDRALILSFGKGRLEPTVPFRFSGAI